MKKNKLKSMRGVLKLNRKDYVKEKQSKNYPVKEKVLLEGIAYTIGINI